MTKQHFENLLNDLYDIYNKDKKSEITTLVQKFNGQEFDSIYQILFKYNYQRSPLYNPGITTPQFVKLLIDSYSADKRVLKDQDFVKKYYNNNIKIEGFVEKQVSEAKEELSKNIDEIDKNIQDRFEKTLSDFSGEIYSKKKELQEIFENNKAYLENYIKKLINEFELRLSSEVKNIDNKNESTVDEPFEIKLNLLWTDREINIPSSIKNCCVGDRIITTDVNGVIVGLEIQDIIWDCISNQDKIIKDITLNIS